MNTKEQIRSLELKLRDTEHMMDSLVHNMSIGIIRVYYDGDSIQIVYMSDTIYRLFGCEQDRYDKFCDTDTEHVFEIFPEYKQKLEREAKRAMNGEVMASAEFCVSGKDGSKTWLHVRTEVISESKNGILIQYMVMDITESHEMLEKMRQEQQKLSIIVEIAADLLFEYDIKNDAMFYTKQRADGLNAEQISCDYLKTIRSEGWVHPDDMEAFEDFYKQMSGGKQEIHTQLRKRFADRKFHWIEVDGRTIYDENGVAEKVIGKITNIDSRMEKEEMLKVNSEKDSLTGLYNHMTCIDKVRKQLKQLKPGDTCVLMICDIDNFKQINDNNGHLFGDAVICTFADEVRSIFPSSIKGRIGGDEFLIFVRNMTQELVEQKLQQLNQKFSKLNVEDGNEVKISCSIGAVVCTYEHRDYEESFHLADSALYKVKNNNKGTFLITEYDEEDMEAHQSYLESKEEKNDYVREESLISSDEELVLFSLELLDNVADPRIGLKMVSDRICRYFGFDDIIYIKHDGKNYEKVYHWGSQKESSFESRILDDSVRGWEYVEQKYDEQGVAILTRKEMEALSGCTYGAMMLVKYDEPDGSSRLVIFIDRLLERSWEIERAAMIRLSSIIYNRILKMKKEEKNLADVEMQMNYDSVTGLPNYSKFLTLSEQYLQEKGIHKQPIYYLFYADFSNFQYLNEVYGYAVGDAVLQRFAKTLQECPHGIYFSRITSDHYSGLIWEKDDSLEEIQQYLQKFCDTINKEYTLCNLTLICGLYRVENMNISVSAMVDCANVARKHGKNKAETCCILYDEEIKERNETEMSVVAHMTSALENREFQVYLQPKINLHTGKSVGAEALVRWKKKDGIMFYPDQFIPVFERNGFITKVDFYVLEEVLCYLRKMIDAGEEVVPISVNFSRLHNNDNQFVEKIQALLDKYNIEPSLLEAEVTESVYMYDFNGLREKAKRLQELGVLISIDDFGSGYSSLNVLSKVSADIIKLDRQFLIEDEAGASPEFIKYLINMIKHLGYQIIAEGVETKEQAEMLKGANCDLVQGYYYARPMPMTDFRNFLHEFNDKSEE